jgi:hypothetical protein
VRRGTDAATTDRGHERHGSRGFYPWFIRALEARYPDASETTFREKLRFADCLMTLIAERHAITTQDDIGRRGPGRFHGFAPTNCIFERAKALEFTALTNVPPSSAWKLASPESNEFRRLQ